MDFYKYLYSRDVAEHLRKMDYQFNTLECAWIIDASENITLAEKRSALEYILTMPDYIYRSSDRPNGISVHQTVRDHFDYVELIKNELTEKDDNTFYTYHVLLKEKGWTHYAKYFRDYESCMASYFEMLVDSISPSGRGGQEILGYKIEKIPLDGTHDNTILAEYQNGELTSLFKYSGEDPLSELMNGSDPFSDILDEMCFPTPFLPGDILYEPVKNRPMVLSDLPGPGSGMFLMGYRVSDDEKAILHECFSIPYTYMEYYRGELRGADLALSVISDFIKNGGREEH